MKRVRSTAYKRGERAGRNEGKNHQNLRGQNRGEGQPCRAVILCIFANKNDEPELLMEVAHWWIMEMKLDHFEKAEKIKSLVLDL